MYAHNNSHACLSIVLVVKYCTCCSFHHLGIEWLSTWWPQEGSTDHTPLQSQHTWLYMIQTCFTNNRVCPAYFKTIFNLHHLQFFLSLKLLVLFTENSSWNTHTYACIAKKCELQLINSKASDFNYCEQKHAKMLIWCYQSVRAYTYRRCHFSYGGSGVQWSVLVHSRHMCLFPCGCGKTKPFLPFSLHLRGSEGKGHSELWAAGTQKTNLVSYKFVPLCTF